MRIFVTPLAAGEVVVRGDEHHYLARVRRARSGDAIELVDGGGRRAAAVIENIGEAETVLRAGAVEDIVEPAPHVRALVPLVKGDRMDSCLEKLVEVGADELVVWPAARSVVRLDDDARRDARLAHYQATAQAAARQSGRARVPVVTYARSLAAALAALPAGGARLVLDPSAERAAVTAAAAAEDVTIASGPEGGLAPDELDALAAAGFASLGLGPNVLRADTAPVVAVALVRAAR
jgi:16S rRNA (uracil1498-N3)-methyltransferase